jgi:hypothetical protein
LVSRSESSHIAGRGASGAAVRGSGAVEQPAIAKAAKTAAIRAQPVLIQFISGFLN